MPTKTSLVPKYFYFWMAVAWTSIIGVLCLVSFTDLPGADIEIKSADKYVHATFHFVFTFLWYLHFRQQFPNVKNRKIVAAMLAFSIGYGILIEVAQKLFTLTRHADVRDVLANLTGAVLAVLVIILSAKTIQKRLV